MKWVDLKNINTDELIEIMAKKRAEVQALRFQAKGSQLKQVHKISEAKKSIAKIKSMLQERKKEEK